MLNLRRLSLFLLLLLGWAMVQAPASQASRQGRKPSSRRTVASRQASLTPAAPVGQAETQPGQAAVPETAPPAEPVAAGTLDGQRAAEPLGRPVLHVLPQRAPPLVYNSLPPPAPNPWYVRLKRQCRVRHGLPPGKRNVVPLGALVQAPVTIQIVNGQAARMALYAMDFFDGEKNAALLSPRGWRQVVKLAGVAEQWGLPIAIEPSGNPALDAARREQVLVALARLGYVLPEEQVLVAPPIAGGLAGAEAYQLYENAPSLMQGGAGGQAGPLAGQGAAGGAGGGGMSMQSSQ